MTEGELDTSPRRPQWLTVPGRDQPLALPAFFPSVSSVKSDVPVPDVLALHRALQSPAFLLSAYDFARAAAVDRHSIEEAVENARRDGAVILLDSGRYEAHWLRDGAWGHEEYSSALRALPVQLAFVLDDPIEAGLPVDLARRVQERVLRDQAIREDTLVLPIVHGSPEVLPETVALVGEHLSPPVIAVPERELGFGIVDRVATVAHIRAALDRSCPGCALHLLGTGNPISILIYAIAGADSFDGLEWCETVVDPQSARLHHLQHFDFFGRAGEFSDAKGPYRARAYAHNLAFMWDWMRRVQDDAAAKAHPLLTDVIGLDSRHLLAERLPEIFG